MVCFDFPQVNAVTYVRTITGCNEFVDKMKEEIMLMKEDF